MIVVLFFFNDTATTEIYTLSLHDALPISRPQASTPRVKPLRKTSTSWKPVRPASGITSGSLPYDSRKMTPSSMSPGEIATSGRSEEHTSELQSRQYLVCRLLLEKTTQERC